MRRFRPTKKVWLFIVFTLVGLLFSTSFYLDDLARLRGGTWLTRFIEEMTGSYTVLVLFPAIALVARRFPLGGATWRTALPIAGLAALAYTIAHTTLMLLSRSLIFPLTGLGRYDYGVMAYRYPMEAAKDVMTFSVIYGALHVWRIYERGRAAEFAAAGLETKLAQARLENLRLQLHPHFLFNTLNAISAVMYEDVRKADRMLSQLSDFLRVVLDSSGVRHVRLSEELRVERMYVEIMRTRLERQLRLTVSVAADAADAEIPFMLLQPLLENSIRHGLRSDRSALDIDIAAQRARHLVIIDVVDNGLGYVSGGACGHGLRNVASRLEHTFGADASFSIVARPTGGTHVRLSYPYAAEPAVGTPA
jgi:two-component system LytT family sensor kinase